jgi:hypothetical protein
MAVMVPCPFDRCRASVQDADHRLAMWPLYDPRVRRLLALAVIAVLAVAGCDQVGDQLDQATNDAAEEVLTDAVREQLSQAGIELEGDPDCTTDLSRDGTTLTGTAECAGTTVDGLNATAMFDGTLSTSGCEGSLAVEVDGRQVVDLAEIPGCSVEL